MVNEFGVENCYVVMLDVIKCVDWVSVMFGFSDVINGKMDVLFNNVGIGCYGWFEDIELEEFDFVVDVNVKGVINGVYVVLFLFKEIIGLCIVNMVLIVGIVGLLCLVVYLVIKFVVWGLIEVFDVELLGLGICCISLMFWFIDMLIFDMGVIEGLNVKMVDEICE